MRIHDLDVWLLEEHLTNTRKDISYENTRDNSRWWLFVLDMERSLKLLKEQLDPYGELDNKR